MSVYKPKNSPYYQFDFQVSGQRFHGSTGCKNERDARAVERDQREKAKAAVKAAKASGGGPLTIDDAAARYWREVGERHANADTTWTDLGRLVDYLARPSCSSTSPTMMLRSWFNGGGRNRHGVEPRPRMAHP